MRLPVTWHLSAVSKIRSRLVDIGSCSVGLSIEQTDFPIPPVAEYSALFTLETNKLAHL